MRAEGRNVLMVWVCLAGMAAHGASITLDRFEVGSAGPGTLRIVMAASGHGVEVGSYGVRTYLPDGLKSLSGFVPRNRHLYCVPEGTGGSTAHMLLDNGPADRDDTTGRFELEVSVAEWPDGMYTFLCYADNRPNPGRYVAARRRIRVTVKDGIVDAERTGELDMISVRILDWRVAPEEVTPGQPFTVVVNAETNDAAGVAIRLVSPYTVAPDEVPPGFEYDAATKHFRGPSGRSGTPLTVSTRDWRPGVVHFSIVAEVEGAGGQVSAYRDAAVRVMPADPAFSLEVESDTFLCKGTHFGTMCRLSDGSVLAHGHVTRDGGRTWERVGSAIPMAHQLADGEIVGLAMRTSPVSDEPGWFTTTLYRSQDGGHTVATETVRVHVPDATAGIGHAPAPGPLFWRSIVDGPDKRLLAAMYGWFKGDDVPVPGQEGSTRYRTFVVESSDRGRSWEYLSTVAYDPSIGTEGYCEPVIRRLPGGDLMCLLRTGGNNRPYWQDNPLCQTRSSDEGRTWAVPERTGVEGVSPDLCVMHDGVLACAYGRPGADLMLSADNGRTWTAHTCIDPERYSGYAAVCEVEPGILLYGYGAMDRIDEETGDRSNQIRVARIRVTRH